MSLTSASDPGRHIGAALGTLSGGRAPSRVLCIGHSLGGALATLGQQQAVLELKGIGCLKSVGLWVASGAVCTRFLSLLLIPIISDHVGSLQPRQAHFSLALHPPCPTLPPGATWAALQWPGADVRCITFGSPRVGNRKFVR